MKAIFIILVLLVLMAGCATTETNNSEPRYSNNGSNFDPQLHYGGSFRVRAASSDHIQQ